MKFKLYKELLNESSVMSHIFLDSVDKNMSEEIADETNRLFDEGKSKKWVNDNREIDISLTIEGKEVNPKKFFDNLFNSYEKIVKKEAGNIIKEQTSDELVEIQDKISMLKEMVDAAAENIDWDTKFLKNK